jgi:hypothetical protein
MFRADEMCFDPVDNVVMATNNADSPPFASVFDAGTVGSANKKIVAQIPWNSNTNGAEQCVYNPRTGLLYETAPELNGPGDNSQPGGVAVVDPKVAIAQNFSGTPGPGQGNDVPVVATWVLPLTACDGPQGMAVGPTPQMLVGCNGGPSSAQSKDASVVINDGSTGGTPGSVIAELQNQDGPDMVWYDSSTRQYLLARSTATTPANATTGTPTNQAQLGIVSANTFIADISIPTIATSSGAHSVATDSASRNGYFPIPKASAASKLCSSAGGTDANGCILVLTRQVSNTHDFNADTTSDLLWRDTSGNVGQWLMQAANCSNTQVSSSAVAPIKSTNTFGQVATTWSIVGQRDLVGTGSSSILWRDTAGDFGIWLMSTVLNSSGSDNICALTGGAQITGIANMGPIPTTWSVVGTGEFNANGMGDILWQDNNRNLAVWLMNGTTILSARSIAQLPAGYTVVGSDRRGWIFLNNATTNDVTVWAVSCPGSSTTCSVTATDFGTVPAIWKIKAIGDLDGNGFSDIVWMDTSNNVGAWFLGTANGAPAVLSSTVYGTVGAQWSIAQTGDMNGDGKADIVWADTSGNIGAWFMNGKAISSTTIYGNVGTSWSIQALNSQ